MRRGVERDEAGLRQEAAKFYRTALEAISEGLALEVGWPSLLYRTGEDHFSGSRSKEKSLRLSRHLEPLPASQGRALGKKCALGNDAHWERMRTSRRGGQITMINQSLCVQQKLDALGKALRCLQVPCPGLDPAHSNVAKWRLEMGQWQQQLVGR